MTEDPNPQGFGLNTTIQAEVTTALYDDVKVGITSPGGSETNYSMYKVCGYHQYNYSSWQNGTFNYTIYANDTYGKENFSNTDDFDIYVNLSIQVKTIKDVYGVGETVNLTDPPGSTDDVGIVISGVYVEPEDVKPGDSMLVSADVESGVGVESVEAEMPHEKGLDVLILELISGDEFDGTWQAYWAVHDTLDKDYTTVVRARDSEGGVGEAEVGWTDASYSYDYTNLTGKKAYQCTGGLPANPFSCGTVASGADYTKMSVSDDIRFTQAFAFFNMYDYEIFIFNVSQNPANIIQLGLTWEGYGDTAVGYYTNISFYNWTSGSWFIVNATDFTSATDQVITETLSSGLDDFINDTQVAILVHAKKGPTCGDGWAQGAEVCDSDFTDQCLANPSYYKGGYDGPGGCGFSVACKNDCTACIGAAACNTIICFVAGTEITMADESVKDIEDVRVGDWVMTVDMETMEPEPKQVLEVASPIHDDIVVLGFEHAENKNTFDHPYYVKDKGWSSYKPDWTSERYGL